MRYLGVDYGGARIGIACTDEDGRFAFPKTVLKASDEEADEICAIAKAEQVQSIVMGLPPVMAGMDASVRNHIQELAESIRSRCGLPVEFENEMFTTQIAEMHSSKNTDAAAAALILQSFLDRINQLR